MGCSSVSRVLRSLAAAAAAALALPSAAAAMSVTFEVTNARGIPQLTDVMGPSDFSFRQVTDPYGHITLGGLNPGDKVSFSRDGGGQLGEAPSCYAPEDAGPGVSYTVPATAPSTSATVVVPDAAEPYHPDLSPQESWIVAGLNRARTAHGLAPLLISTTLNAAADETARASVLAHAFPPPHCQPMLIDAGWPSDGFLFEDDPGTNPQAALAHWDGSEGTAESTTLAQHGVLDPKNTAVGVGDGDGWFIVEYNDCPPTMTGADRCGMTTDQGNPNAWTPPAKAGGTPTTGTPGGGGATPNSGFGTPGASPLSGAGTSPTSPGTGVSGSPPRPPSGPAGSLTGRNGRASLPRCAHGAIRCAKTRLKSRAKRHRGVPRKRIRPGGAAATSRQP